MWTRLFILRNYAIGTRHQPPAAEYLDAIRSSIRHYSTRSSNACKLNYRIINGSQSISALVSRSTIEESNIVLNDLELQVGNKSLLFNLTWLRDCCSCGKCTHQHSKQRLFTAKHFTPDNFGIKALKDGQDGNSLHVYWSDGHESSYSIDWLQKTHDKYNESTLKLCDKSRDFKCNFDEGLSTWNVREIESSLKPVNYHDLIDGFKFNDDENYINANKISAMNVTRLAAMCNLVQQLKRYGIAKIVNVPIEKNQVLNVARTLAYERPTGYGVVFDVIVEQNEEINLAYSSLEFDLHTDLPYREMSPGVKLLHCIRDSDTGGLSYFSDTFKAAQILLKKEPLLFESLLKYPITFQARDPYRDIEFSHYRPIITLDHSNKLKDVYYSPFMEAPVGYLKDIKLFYLAQDKLTRLLQSKENKVVTKMNPGDLFIFNNRRVLHGRSAYDASTSSRFFQGCYMDWDEITGLHDKLSRYMAASNRQ